MASPGPQLLQEAGRQHRAGQDQLPLDQLPSAAKSPSLLHPTQPVPLSAPTPWGQQQRLAGSCIVQHQLGKEGLGACLGGFSLTTLSLG